MKTRILLLSVFAILGCAWVAMAQDSPPQAVASQGIKGMALIPAGTFEMGDHHGFVDPRHGSDEIPIHKVRLDAFYIGINDVTTREYAAFLNAALAEKNYSGEFRVRIPPLVHRNLALMAAEQGVSLNRLASAKLAA